MVTSGHWVSPIRSPTKSNRIDWKFAELPVEPLNLKRSCIKRGLMWRQFIVLFCKPGYPGLRHFLPHSTGSGMNLTWEENYSPQSRYEQILFTDRHKVILTVTKRVIELRHKFWKISLTSAKINFGTFINFGTRNPFALGRSKHSNGTRCRS